MSRRLRIGVVLPAWSLPGEPPALPALQVQLGALAADHDLRVVALRHPAVAATFIDPGGIHVTAPGAGSTAGVRGRGRVLLSGVDQLRRLHAAQRFDVLHGYWADEPGAVTVTAARLLGLPAAVSVMGGELVALDDIGYGAALGRGGRWTARLSLERADVVSVGSETLLRDVAPRVRVAPRLLPLGVDLERFSPLSGRVDGPPTVVFAGSLTQVKDPVLALRAFRRLRTRETRLIVAGDGPMRAELERLARHLGIADRVRFHGHVSRDRLGGILGAARVLLVTSRHESQSMVAVEAAASGIGVVGTAVGVVPELATAGGGISSVERSPAALSTALDAALAGACWRQLGDAARAHAESRWDLRATTARFTATWSELAGPRVRHRR